MMSVGYLHTKQPSMNMCILTLLICFGTIQTKPLERQDVFYSLSSVRSPRVPSIHNSAINLINPESGNPSKIYRTDEEVKKVPIEDTITVQYETSTEYIDERLLVVPLHGVDKTSKTKVEVKPNDDDFNRDRRRTINRKRNIYRTAIGGFGIGWGRGGYGAGHGAGHGLYLHF